MTTSPPPILMRPLVGPVDAAVELPGSKSLSNRALAISALALGVSELRDVLDADDTDSMSLCLRGLGADIKCVGTDRYVRGVAGEWKPGPVELDVGRGATVARFLLPSLLLGSGKYTVYGHEQIKRRPMKPLFGALRRLGMRVEDQGGTGKLPVDVTVDGHPSDVLGTPVTGDVSSQFLSGLLLAGPCLPGGLTVDLRGDLVSKPYISMTMAVMRHFGATVEPSDEGRYVVAPGGYVGSSYQIEPDASAASYFFAAAAICGGRVRVSGLSSRSLQGDLQFVHVLEKMGVKVKYLDDGVEVVSDGRLHGIAGGVDMSDISDTAQTLAMVAAFADSPTKVTGIGFIREKETDRIGNLVEQMQGCGVDAHEEAGGFVVRPSRDTLRPWTVNTHDDHRMAMSFALLGLRTDGIRIEDPGCVKKTFPGYFDKLETLRHPD